MDDIEQVLQVIKDIKNVELHIDIGDLKLSVWKGNIGDSTRSSLEFSRESTVCLPKQPEQTVAPTAAASVKKEEPKAQATVEVDRLQPGTSRATGAPKVAKGEEAIPEGLVAIRASVTSVFYRKPSPLEPPFVEVGSEVKEDSVLCLLEVMKCYRSVNAGVKGRVEKILVESGQLVEYGTVLFLIRPS